MPAAKGSARTPLGPKNAIYSGHLRFCLQPRAAHALRSDQNKVADLISYVMVKKFKFVMKTDLISDAARSTEYEF